MNTDITDEKASRGWVLYDGACEICKGTVRRFGPAFRRRGFACVPLQTPWVRDRLNLSETELMLEMRVLEPSGKVVGGAAAVLLLARTFWWARPLVWLAKVPGVFGLLDAAYHWGAAKRYCANGACAVPRKTRHGYLFLLLPLGTPFVLRGVEPWVLMWAMAGALWLALKLFTLFEVARRPLARSLAYLAWPGMDGPEFFRTNAVPRPALREWLVAALNIAMGVTLVYGAAAAAHPHSILLAGWLAMVGVVLILHFGLFKCLAMLWRARGIPVTSIMDAPLRSRSLSEFWGRRWNTGFSIPARRYLMEPITRRFGAVAGLLTVFLVSGLVHELVISLPAKAGYGLPTLYFLIQAAGLICERIGARTVCPHVSTAADKLSALRSLLIVAVPAFILFHPPFVHRVIIPFLKAIGAL